MENNMLNNQDVFKSIHEPYWIASSESPDYPQLNENISVDVAIIGGGLVGLTCGYLLKQKGLKIAVLDAGKIAHGTTGHTTAKITSQHDLIYENLISNFGREKAQQYASANEYAIHFIAKLVEEENINCDFMWLPAYVYTQSDNYVDSIENEVKAASSLGIKAFFQDNIPLPFNIKAAVRFDDQAQFHPLKYILHLAGKIPGDGSYIFERTKVVDINENTNCRLKTASGKIIAASRVIVASHFPCYDGLGLYFARMYVEKSYALGVKINGGFPDGMFITAEDPGRSLRKQKYEDGEIVIVGGEHHKTGNQSATNVHYKNLADFAKQTFDLQSILFRWSTQDCMTADKVPYIGYLTSNTHNILVATGFKKWGMTTSTAAALILTDLITKGDNPWAPVFDPSRFDPAASAAEIITQNADVAVNLVKGKLFIAPEDVDIKNNEASVISRDGNKYGVYRDENGKLHAVDITCTHLGCELVWNEAEKTWDCPCHGSRFSYDGENVEGPAFNPLNHQDEGPNKKDANIL